jgi:hypothetical protein
VAGGDAVIDADAELQISIDTDAEASDGAERMHTSPSSGIHLSHLCQGLHLHVKSYTAKCVVVGLRLCLMVRVHLCMCVAVRVCVCGSVRARAAFGKSALAHF